MNFPRKFDLCLSYFNFAEIVKRRRFDGDHRMKGITVRKEENEAIIVKRTSPYVNYRTSGTKRSRMPLIADFSASVVTEPSREGMPSQRKEFVPR